jgi:hypothetical protein
MKLILPTIATALLFLALVVPAAQAQSGKPDSYPSDEEINLLVGQIDRAMTQYQQLVEQETKLLGDSADTATDMQLLKFWGIMKVELTKSPQKFNSFVGFDVATTVDDASRNAALISNTAALEVLKQITGRAVTPKTDSLVTLMQNANANGTLLYTISENAAALYRTFLHWQGDTFLESVAALSKCANASKKN